MNIHDAVRDFIVHNFYVPDADNLGDDTPLFEQGIIDSTGVLEVLAFVETTLETPVDDRDMLPENFASISCISAFVERKHGRAA